MKYWKIIMMNYLFDIMNDIIIKIKKIQYIVNRIKNYMKISLK